MLTMNDLSSLLCCDEQSNKYYCLQDFLEQGLFDEHFTHMDKSNQLCAIRLNDVWVEEDPFGLCLNLKNENYFDHAGFINHVFTWINLNPSRSIRWCVEKIVRNQYDHLGLSSIWKYHQAVATILRELNTNEIFSDLHTRSKIN